MLDAILSSPSARPAPPGSRSSLYYHAADSGWEVYPLRE